MAPLTRWVLAHKRIVVVTWLVLLFAGIAASGPASDALDQKFSVPNKEGWETNQAIAKHYRGTGGDTAPLLPVVTLPKGQSVTSPQVKAGLAQVDKRLARALLLLTHSTTATEPQLLLPNISQKMLAQTIGTTRSRVNGFLRKFRRLGFIDYCDGALTVRPSLLSVVLQA